MAIKEINGFEDFNGATVKEVFEYLGKSLMAKIAHYLTILPPFSFFWRDRLFHFKNRFVQSYVIMIESASRRIKIPVHVIGTEVDDYFLRFYLLFKKENWKEVRTTDIFLNSMSKKLGLEKEEIYFQSIDRYLIRRLLIPKESCKRIT